MTEVIFFSREPPLRYRAEKRRDHGIFRKFRGPASSQLYFEARMLKLCTELYFYVAMDIGYVALPKK